MFEGRFGTRTAIVTGGASGLGKEVARRIVAEGGRAILWDLNKQALTDAVKDVGALGAVVVDVASPEAVENAAAESLKLSPRIELLLNSAGITGPTASVVTYPIDGWERVININLNGLFYCCRAILPSMLDGGYGRIVNVSSIGGKEGNPNASAYAASKAGVIGFTKALGKEVARSGIIVNAVTPAVFDSPLLSQMPQTQIDYMKSLIPMGRFGRVEETTALICFLLSEECSFSTAATFDTSGGRATY